MKRNLVITTAVVAAFAALAAGSGGGGSSSGGSTGTEAPAENMTAEIASKGAAGTLRDHLQEDVCDSSHHARTPYVDLKEKVTPFASAHILYGQWIDPGVEGLDSSKNDQVQSLTPDDLGWYGALDALCNPATVCTGDSCVLTEPDLYAQTRIEVRVDGGTPKIAAVFKGMSIGGANTPALTTAYNGFVTAITAQLPAGTAAAAAPPPAPPSAPPSGT